MCEVVWPRAFTGQACGLFLVPGTVQDTVETKPGQAYALSTGSSGRRLIETTSQRVNIQKDDWPL